MNASFRHSNVLVGKISLNFLKITGQKKVNQGIVIILYKLLSPYQSLNLLNVSKNNSDMSVDVLTFL